MRGPIHGAADRRNEEEANLILGLGADADQALEPDELCLKRGQREVEVDFPGIIYRRYLVLLINPY